jgi:GT2 family glycosyltransferase
MLRLGVQRLAGLAPGAARAVWSRLPAALQAGLRDLVYPIALGARSSGLRLEVAAGAVRRFDVVVVEPLSAAERHRAAELGAAGHRVFELAPDAPLERLAREHDVFDALIVGEIGQNARRDAARLGLRSAREPAFPGVSVVIVAFGGVELLRACLAALSRNTGWPELELIAVDNGTRDGTRSFLEAEARQNPRLTLIRNETNLGFARAANQGIRRATGEYVVLLNDDTVVAPGWLSRLIAALEREPALGLVCATTNHIGNAAQVPAEYATLDEMEQLARSRAFSHAGQLLGLTTVALFCAAMRRRLLEAIGLLDQRFEIGMFEDDDLSRTLRERGLLLGVALDAFVHHVGQASFERLSAREYLAIWEANRRRFETKWGERWTTPAPS